ncbi:MAG: hypothetical protein AAF281_01225 [Pseudomonadota bacterium]
MSARAAGGRILAWVAGPACGCCVGSSLATLAFGHRAGRRLRRRLHLGDAQIVFLLLQNQKQGSALEQAQFDRPTLTDAQHIVDAACDADHPRAFIADVLGVTAHIKRNRIRREDRIIGWVLNKDRHLVECFFNRIKRFRLVALRCEKAVSAFKTFVDLACARARIG